MNDLISVIVPVYNSEQYLAKCIDSIIGQTYTNLEIILVNDGSTDKSREICEEYCKKDNRVVVINKKNGGSGSARNIGIEAASGKYIGFVDSDDFIDLQMYELLYNGITQHDVQVVACGRYDITDYDLPPEASFVLDKPTVFSKKEVIKKFLLTDGVDSSAVDKLYYAKLLINHRFNTELISEDVPFVFGIMMQIDKLLHIGKPLYYYLQRTGSRSRGYHGEKTKGLTEFPKEVRLEVIDKIKELEKEADYYYYPKLLIAIDMCINSNFFGDYYKTCVSQIKKNYKKIVKNPYANKRLKLRAFLVKIGIYRFLKQIKAKLRVVR